ncbi:hypothetical protein SAMN04488065_2154 [Haloplanus vescus]|uniref:Uncharacterized protein n=1 Tax=Haloplanus vescus TaxID=555874 RepID=A0A1H3Z4P9_9EURY|nr:hypothetical protein [Haloplanus vescus]SEA18666.1 hypothetical protein SAMN04488065_2154 [Haloplanus vescus]
MAPTGFPTGTVSSGREESETGRRPTQSADTDLETRVVELERENAALRDALEQQRRENERIVERYERLLDQERGGDEAPSRDETPADPADAGALARVARFFGV